MSTIDTTEKRERGDAALFDAAVLVAAMRAAFGKLAPRHLLRSPVMAVVMGGTVLAAVITASGHAHAGFGWAVTAILFVTVLFGNFAEAIAEARGRGQAASLRRARKDLVARRVETALGGRETRVPAAELRPGDYVMVSEGEFVPADGEIVRGVATINEAAVTGESAPVLREAGTDRSGVIGGTRVLSDEIVFKVTAEPGHSFLDRMIALVEGANRQKTPNEIALTLLLAAMTLTFLIVVASLPAIAGFVGVTLDPLLLIALLVCLIPTTIGGLLPAIGIAGMNRALSANVLADPARQWKWPATWMCCCSTRPAPLPMATARPPHSIPWLASTAHNCAMRPCLPRWPIRRRKGNPSSSWRVSKVPSQWRPRVRISSRSPHRRACPVSILAGAASARAPAIRSWRMCRAWAPRCRPNCRAVSKKWRVAAPHRWWWPKAAMCSVWSR